MQNTNDWQTTLAGLALVGKALAEDGDEGHQAAILEHIQGALREGYRCVVTPPPEAPLRNRDEFHGDRYVLFAIRCGRRCLHRVGP